MNPMSSNPMPSMVPLPVRLFVASAVLAAIGLVGACLPSVDRPDGNVEPELDDDDGTVLPGTGAAVASGEVPSAGSALPLPPVEPAVDPVAEMMQRYRPGPYVAVESTLPSERVEGSEMNWMIRADSAVQTPWVVNQARIRGGAFPDDGMIGAADGPTLAHAPGEVTHTPLHIIPGTPIQTDVYVSDPDGLGDIVAIEVSYDGYDGHFSVPLMVSTEVANPNMGEQGAVPITFAINSPVLADGRLAGPLEQFPATMRVRVVDRDGNVSGEITRPLLVMPLGTGDVEVTLTMGAATDMDLWVTDPSGQVIYYGNTSSGTGGQLDLDANSACGGNMGVNNEHIFWPQGRAPAGDYHVRVAHWSSCIGGRPVDYRVTVQNCGETVVFSGNFTGQGDSRDCRTDPGQDRNHCQQVVSFAVTPCDQL